MLSSGWHDAAGPGETAEEAMLVIDDELPIVNVQAASSCEYILTKIVERASRTASTASTS